MGVDPHGNNVLVFIMSPGYRREGDQRLQTPISAEEFVLLKQIAFFQPALTSALSREDLREQEACLAKYTSLLEAHVRLVCGAEQMRVEERMIRLMALIQNAKVVFSSMVANIGIR